MLGHEGLGVPAQIGEVHLPVVERRDVVDPPVAAPLRAGRAGVGVLPEPAALQDAWGRQFHYVQPGVGDPPRPYDLWSLGADGVEGGSGADADILSWERGTMSP